MAPSLVFKVTRSEAVVVQPARPTPIEVKSLSDWDNRAVLRYPVSVILLFKQSSGATDEDPAERIKRALAEALVYYYPWAGRMKEGTDGKLVVDCTAEGVVFVEADAEVKLDQFGEDSFQPPFPCIEELLYCKGPAVVDKIPPLGSPLFTMQVTRLICGGFILTFTFDHVMSDGYGAALFLTAIAEIAGGAPAPSVLPIWRREEFLKARDPPHPAPSPSQDDRKAPPLRSSSSGGDVSTYTTFFFGSREVAAIRAHVPPHLQESCTSFELIVACVLHCRVTTFQHAPDERVRVAFPVNCRNRFVDNPIPLGYYGNVSFPATFICPVQDLHDLGCAVGYIKKAKEAVNEDYIQSMVDIEVIRRRSPAAPSFQHSYAMYFFLDWSRVGFSTLDFGCGRGKPVYVGIPCNIRRPDDMNFMVAFTNQNGDRGRLLTLYMSKHAMERFSMKVRSLLGSN